MLEVAGVVVAPLEVAHNAVVSCTVVDEMPAPKLEEVGLLAVPSWLTAGLLIF